MKAVVIYESMYGNTHKIADAIAEGLRGHGDAVVVPLVDARPSAIHHADLVVVGGPTHAHGMSHAATRKGAVEAAEKPGSNLVLDGGVDDAQIELGLREWFASLGEEFTNAAAFDTRFNYSPARTGRASKGIARKLRRHGATLIAKPESFFVTKDNRLEAGEEDRARLWGEELAGTLVVNDRVSN
jgi:menaquinone-dependent protoporphyrinogen IX oxidase